MMLHMKNKYKNNTIIRKQVGDKKSIPIRLKS